MGIIRPAVILAVAAALVVAWNLASRELLPSARPSGPVSYYLSPVGNDHAAGTSPATAWRTLARASAAKLRPGDRLLLRGDHVYQGELLIGKSDSGTPAKHVLISSYGRGRATIASHGSGLIAFDAANLTISDLVIVGRDAMQPSTGGLQVYSDLLHTRPAHIVIKRVDVSGFGYGITIGGINADGGFRDVSVQRSAVHGNLDAGLLTYGPVFNPRAPTYANVGIHISRVRAFGNRGDPANTWKNSGSGIELASVSGATVTMSSAYDNGGLGGAPREGPEGIWAYDSRHVVFEHDVAYDNQSKSREDGGGFGFDQGTSDSVIEYNLSYRNHGPGYLLYASHHDPQTGNVVRFNISYHDARGGANLGGLAVGGHTLNLAVYQNTVVAASAGPEVALRLFGILDRIHLFNNVFTGSSGGFLVLAVHNLTMSHVLLAGNDYAAPRTGNWKVKWRGTTYRSLAAWRAADGQELIKGKPTGLVAPPLFVRPEPSKSGGAGFALRRASALRGTGLDLVRMFGLHPGKINYAGLPYLTGRPNVGSQ